MRWKQVGAGLLAAVMSCGTSLGLQAANNSHMIPYTAGYDSERYPQKSMEAVFTKEDISVDGKMDNAYLASQVSPIRNVRPAEGYAYDDGEETFGLLRALWDGPVLYLLVEVHDSTPVRETAAAQGPGGNPAVPGDMDSVVFGIDLYNDKVVYETDTIGVFTIGSNGELYYYRNKNIPSLGSPMADPIHPEYQNRIRDYAVADLVGEDGVSVTGYTVELSLQLEGLPLTNGTVLGVDVQISDAAVLEEDSVEGEGSGGVGTDMEVSGSDVSSPGVSGGDVEDQEVSGGDVTGQEAIGNDNAPGDGAGEDVVLKTAAHATASPAVRVGNVFWSHAQDSLYAEWNHEHPNALDWGNLTLGGWNGTDEFAYSDWRLTNAIRYLDSIAFPKGVYTLESQKALDEARGRAEEVLALARIQGPDKAAADDAADSLEAAIAGLRWADTRYPDPDELTDQMTLPNPYVFFGSSRVVKNKDDWKERRAEILDLAQFYEYGYKPGAPDDQEVTQIVHYNAGDKRTVLMWGFWPMEVTVDCPTDVLTMDITVSGKTSCLEFTVYRPTDEQLKASGHEGGTVPVVLSYDGDSAVYRDAGFAVVEVPAGSGGDGRSNEYAWGTRTGTFYELYPYSRNGENALKEVSSEMAAAWSATRVIDALETLENCGLTGAQEIADAIDPCRLAVTGFSINGKYAFVAAVFDERIDVCIPGAAGATGPSPWRYVYTGHEYDWSGTLFAPVDSSQVSAYQVASGTEFMANSVRHNRVRETELFRQFLNPGNFYERLPGAYGYGTRLPFDQNDLIATLAPRAIVLENTVNDYNDGCEADSLGLQTAKAVYRALGYEADDLVKFNQRPVQPGEPHGSDNEQKKRTAEYLDYYFYGAAMDQETAVWLDTDPFSLKVSNGGTQSPYDFYYGGFNTITGGTGGVDGRDGWYYYTFEEESGGDDQDPDDEDGNKTPDTGDGDENQTPAGGDGNQTPDTGDGNGDANLNTDSGTESRGPLKSPKTGEENHVWAASLLAGLLIPAAALAFRKREQDTDITAEK